MGKFGENLRIGFESIDVVNLWFLFGHKRTRIDSVLPGHSPFLLVNFETFVPRQASDGVYAQEDMGGGLRVSTT